MASKVFTTHPKGHFSWPVRSVKRHLTHKSKNVSDQQGIHGRGHFHAARFFPGLIA